MIKKKYSGLIIAGIGGDSGKTFVSCGLLRCAMNKGISVRAFKKGPDYIDPAWLSLAAKSETRNYDTFLMERNTIRKNFYKNALTDGLNVIEGNRGLFDGFNSAGLHSTAELAKLLNIPVVLVVPVKKVTRTVAAIVLGCKLLDRDLRIGGVILNQVANKRQENLIRKAVLDETGINIVGAIPKIDAAKMPSRHLGLITPAEYDFAERSIATASDIICEYVEIDRIIDIANDVPKVEVDIGEISQKNEKTVRIGIFKDKVFTFYYQENLEALEKEAEIVEISSLNDKSLPDIDALYIGGGFPETNIDKLIENQDLMMNLKKEIEKGLPVYAECGGFIYLCDSIELNNKKYSLCNIFPIELKMNEKPAGHGYCQTTVSGENSFYPKGIIVKGHEFHYSSVKEIKGGIDFCLKVNRGNGIYNKKDGALYKNVFASYMHVHSEGCFEWSKGLIKAAKDYRKKRS